MWEGESLQQFDRGRGAVIVESSVNRVMATRRAAARRASRFAAGRSPQTSMPYKTTQYGIPENLRMRRPTGAIATCAQITRSGRHAIAAAIADTKKAYFR